MEHKQKEQLKKVLVFAGLGIIFALAMWFIFAPATKEQTDAGEGLNDNIPQATTEKLTENKLKAYELVDHTTQEEQAREEVGRLAEYFQQEGNSSESNPQEAVVGNKIESSMQRYEENNRLLADFYGSDPYEEEREAMQQEIDDLRRELHELSQQDDDEEAKQLALMEKSYQMAAKYLPAAGASPAHGAMPMGEQSQMVSPPSGGAAKEEAPMEIIADHKPLVSALDQPMSDEEFIEMYGAKERNMSFHSLSNNSAHTDGRNTLCVVVDKTTTLKEGDYVALRLLETARVQQTSIPKHSLLMAQAKIDGNRMQLLIKSIEVNGRILPVKLSAYDTDGQMGVYIPGSEEVSALKEMGANVGGSMGTSFTFSSSAKDQIISEVTRGVMQGAGQLLQKKLRTIKVTLKGGYRLFLVQTK
ncbi:conjugative transposon protein TraM [Porphyromonas asaccharolytica]|uniref:Conjugative transposon TraM protein n=1 Tax=Porphyromonas asaccharolytica (strain ATCC 25260 / DSM 20707 / BCRC 10618 / CCUG 7834 / JCM 6326 / LMG 13178 / VPI 4198 / B440) TaxID=879243 RepID=F4KNM7_PORAD|nr:conjugative transposon protein TraM [Porphyromonas asaccharolytica]AEE13474.1 conjugative transposon TraM protein [Porphyromonas asaccharolytica DSM 20707]